MSIRCTYVCMYVCECVCFSQRFQYWLNSIKICNVVTLQVMCYVYEHNCIVFSFKTNNSLLGTMCTYSGHTTNVHRSSHLDLVCSLLPFRACYNFHYIKQPVKAIFLIHFSLSFFSSFMW